MARNCLLLCVGVLLLVSPCSAQYNYFSVTTNATIYTLEDNMLVTFSLYSPSVGVIFHVPYLPPFGLSMAGDYWCEGVGPPTNLIINPGGVYLMQYSIPLNNVAPGTHDAIGDFAQDNGGGIVYYYAEPIPITIIESVHEMIDVSPPALYFQTEDDLDGLTLQLTNETEPHITLQSYSIEGDGYEHGYYIENGENLFPRWLNHNQPLTLTVVPQLPVHSRLNLENTLRIETDYGPLEVTLFMDEDLAQGVEIENFAVTAIKLTISPNPFNPSTSITFSLSQPDDVELAIYDVRGRLVTILLHGEYNVGLHQVEWNGLDENGLPVASAVYFCRLKASGHEEVRKILLLK